MPVHAPCDNNEERHFFDEERQITIGLPGEVWVAFQLCANRQALEKGWTAARSDWEALNIWLVGRIAGASGNMPLSQWIAQPAIEQPSTAEKKEDMK